MVRDVKEAERAHVGAAGAAPARNLARLQAVPWLIVIALLALSAWLAWRAFGPDDAGDPVAAGLLAFQEQNDLQVFSAEFAPVVASRDSRLFGALQSRQVAVIPARVTYTLPLAQIDRSRLRWNAEAEQLAVQLPALEIGRPNLDEARAQYLREGLWISRDAQDKLTRDNTRVAEQLARRQAGNPVILNMAREAARTAMTQNLSVALHAAGYDDATVTVRFDGEPAGAAALPAPAPAPR